MALEEDQKYRRNSPNNCYSSKANTNSYMMSSRTDKFDEQREGQFCEALADEEKYVGSISTLLKLVSGIFQITLGGSQTF